VPKSKRGKGKQPHYNKARPKQEAPAAVAGTTAPAAPMAAAAASPAVPAAKPVAKPAAPKSPRGIATVLSEAQEQVYVSSDLKRIGLLTGIIVVALIVLAFIFK
jgi:hypothetical protein